MNSRSNRRTPRLQLANKLHTSGNTALAMETPAAMPQLVPSPLVFKGISALTRAWHWLQQRTRTQQASRKLRICESAQLGDKRFVAIIQADGQRFLVGGTSASMSLIAALPPGSDASFKSLLPSDLEVAE